MPPVSTSKVAEVQAVTKDNKFPWCWFGCHTHSFANVATYTERIREAKLFLEGTGKDVYASLVNGKSLRYSRLEQCEHTDIGEQMVG